MTALVFDTETTGFVRKDIPLDHCDQARMIQLGCILLDSQYNERASFSTLIKPNGWQISDGAKNAHGISIEECIQFGMPVDDVLPIFDNFWKNADVVVAHNLKFDLEILNIESLLFGAGQYPSTSGYCTMEASTPICKLPSKIPGKHKWPKLIEAYKHLFGEVFEDAHDALVDCRACARIYKELTWNKQISQT